MRNAATNDDGPLRFELAGGDDQILLTTSLGSPNTKPPSPTSSGTATRRRANREVAHARRRMTCWATGRTPYSVV